MEQLQTQLELLKVAGEEDEQEQPEDGESGALVPAKLAPASAFQTRKEMEKALAGLRRVAAQLREQNGALKRSFLAASGAALRLNEMLSEESTPYICLATSVLLLRALTPRECVEIQKRALEVVRGFANSAMLCTPLESQVAGWRERRQLDRGLLKYALQKRFRRALGTAATLAGRTFLALTEPAQMRCFYSDALDVHVRVVQKVDADNVLLYEEMRAMDAPGSDALVKSLLLVTRFKIANGVRIHVYGIEEDQLPVLDRRERERERELQQPAQDDAANDPNAVVVEIWNSQFCWLQFEDVQDADGPATQFTYAGLTPTVGASAAFWLVEVVLHVLRWESLMLGPIVALDAPPADP